jgi:hypothetical protein
VRSRVRRVERGAVSGAGVAAQVHEAAETRRESAFQAESAAIDACGHTESLGFCVGKCVCVCVCVCVCHRCVCGAWQPRGGQYVCAAMNKK